MQMGGLRLDARAAAMKVIRPGDADSSELYKRIAGIGPQARMPMGGKPLSAAEIALIRNWIAEGAVWPDGVGAVAAEVKPHWAYVAPRRPAVPGGKSANPIDAFVQARLAKRGCGHRAPRKRPRCCAASAWTSQGCRLRWRRWMHSWRT